MTPLVNREERRAILAYHTRDEFRYVEEGAVEIKIQREFAVCGWCGQPWGEDGCQTVRLLHDAMTAEGEIREANDRARESNLQREEAQRAMMQIGSRAEWRINPSTGRWEARCSISSHVLTPRGAHDAIWYSVEEIVKQMQAKAKELNRDRDQEMAIALSSALGDTRKSMARMANASDIAPAALPEGTHE